MSGENPIQITELELKRLENRIDELISLCDQLQEENEVLRNQQQSLIERNEQTRNHVEAIITRLKSVESS